MQDSKKRSIAKSVAFRILVIISDLVVIYLITHRLDATIGITVLTNIVSMTLYYLHERAWNRIGWGRVHATPPPAA